MCPLNDNCSCHEDDEPEVIILHEEINTYWQDADTKSRLTWDEIRELAWQGRQSTFGWWNDADHCAEQAAAATERGDRTAAALWIELAKLHALLHTR